MIDQPTLIATNAVEDHRDERSMRVMEYAMAFIALTAALLLSLH